MKNIGMIFGKRDKQVQAVEYKHLPLNVRSHLLHMHCGSLHGSFESAWLSLLFFEWIARKFEEKKNLEI